MNKKQKEKLHESVAKHVEPDERVCESGLVTNNLKTRNTALVATDRNLYAFRLSWPGQSKVAEQLLAVPIEEARLEGNLRHVRLVDRSTGTQIEQWRRLPVGESDLKALGTYVDSRGAAEGAADRGDTTPGT